jgi:hypothetical protein
MKTTAEIQEFKTELQALLDKHQAKLIQIEHPSEWGGFPPTKTIGVEFSTQEEGFVRKQEEDLGFFLADLITINIIKRISKL